jgi:hypothetical protein
MAGYHRFTTQTPGTQTPSDQTIPSPVKDGRTRVAPRFASLRPAGLDRSPCLSLERHPVREDIFVFREYLSPPPPLMFKSLLKRLIAEDE